MLPGLMVYDSYYFTFSHIYYYCEKRKKYVFQISFQNYKGGHIMTNKKLTKKVCKFEKKHPNITAACVYITGASLALRLVSTIVGGITATKTINDVRKSVNEAFNELKEDNDVVDVEIKNN